MNSDLEQAARQGDAESVRRLLDAGIDVNSRDKHGQTALMLAAMAGHVGVARLLIDRGAELNHTAKYHLTALMLAVIGGHADVAQALANAGADTLVQGSGAPGFSGKTARDLAAARGDAAVMAALSIGNEGANR